MTRDRSYVRLYLFTVLAFALVRISCGVDCECEDDDYTDEDDDYYDEGGDGDDVDPPPDEPCPPSSEFHAHEGQHRDPAAAQSFSDAMPT